MGHAHGGFAHRHDHGPASSPGDRSGHSDGSGTTRRLIIALVINFVFLLVEAIGGWLTNSLALLSDAGHMLTDVGALALAVFARWLAARPAGLHRTFGFRRAEIIAAFVNALLLWVIVGVVVWEAIQRFSAPAPVDAMPMAFIAAAGLLANVVSAWLLHRDHRHDLNVHGAYIHLIADAAGSVGALGAGLIMLGGGSPVADPIASLIIAALIFWGSFGLMRESVEILMEAAPADIDLRDLQEDLIGIPDVRGVHDFHVWRISTGLISLTGHLIVTGEADRDLILMQSQGLLRSRHGIHHVTLQIETEDLHRFLTTEETTVRLDPRRHTPPPGSPEKS